MVAKIRGHGLPVPSDSYTFCERLGQVKGRRILLRPVDMKAIQETGLYAMLLRGGELDIILYHEDATEWHKQWCIMHEAGHVLLDHEMPSVPGLERIAELFVELPADLVVRQLGVGLRRLGLARCGISRREEREAELVAAVVLGAKGGIDGGPSGTVRRFFELQEGRLGDEGPSADR
jgi:hypothetical protein